MKYYIIIPAYNEEAFLSLTLQSLVEQTVLPTKRYKIDRLAELTFDSTRQTGAGNKWQAIPKFM